MKKKNTSTDFFWFYTRNLFAKCCFLQVLNLLLLHYATERKWPMSLSKKKFRFLSTEIMGLHMAALQKNLNIFMQKPFQMHTSYWLCWPVDKWKTLKGEGLPFSFSLLPLSFLFFLSHLFSESFVFAPPNPCSSPLHTSSTAWTPGGQGRRDSGGRPTAVRGTNIAAGDRGRYQRRVRCTLHKFYLHVRKHLQVAGHNRESWKYWREAIAGKARLFETLSLQKYAGL